MLFVPLSPLAAIAGTIAWFASGLFNVQTLVLAVVMAMFAGLGITGGYHRMFSHRSFRAPWAKSAEDDSASSFWVTSLKW